MSMNCKPRCGKIAILALFGIAALSGLVMLLWNWLLPELFFGVKEIGYLQALGLLVLSRILFGGWRGHCGHRHQPPREGMTPEERERLQGRMRNWCGWRRNEADAAADKPDA